MSYSGAANSPLPELKLLIISDGKPGHLNQSLGLQAALERSLAKRVVCNCSIQPPLSFCQNLGLVLGRRPAGWPEKADIVIGAGHASHVTILAASKYYGAKSVVLMKPSLPRKLFDFCVVPEHDGLAETGNTLLSQGALNPVYYQGQKKRHNMILLGGPSKHFEWLEDDLLRQLKDVLSDAGPNQAEPWMILTSRRTPDSFKVALQNLLLNDTEDEDRAAAAFKLIHPDDVASGWLAEQFPLASLCWVSPDSVSMVYEALTAEARVALFDMPTKKPISRVAKGVQELSEQERVDNYLAWSERGKGELKANKEAFNQADKIARKLLALNIVDRVI
ncbi:ELM1/GtrOC1 family putative glycosyltransferase [uncultured Pseudoteredinibacter sp.]|uniref:mitochondrial fission ELM1 family protein n=1 Tax=uncultured Pseudoteredinibacter sp. TaxID=1641701 RepID=UPI002614F76A|nr:ELM1/GtrOC1 family putative glycosyltransferase [uncultured Pseudoteredinibacter sp.]